MNKLMLTAALLLPGLAAVPAAAQDGAPGGFRVGVIGGLDIVRPGSTEDSDVAGDDQSTEGFLYGVEAGYDLPLGGMILGIEGEWSDSTGKTKANRSDPNFFGYGEVASGRDLYIGARLGVEAAPGTLIYAKGGYSNAHLNVLASNGTVDRKEKFRLDGWRIGAGVEHSIGRSSYAKIEYRYSNYTDADFAFRDGSTTNRFEVDTDRHQIVAGVGFRF